MDIRKQNEIKFHDERYVDGLDKRSGFEKFYKVTIYAQNHFKNLIIQNLNKKKLIIYSTTDVVAIHMDILEQTHLASLKRSIIFINL